MRGDVELLGRIRCGPTGCAKTETVTVALEARIGDGGRVDIELIPELPMGWALGNRWSIGYRCAEHTGDQW